MKGWVSRMCHLLCITTSLEACEPLAERTRNETYSLRYPRTERPRCLRVRLSCLITPSSFIRTKFAQARQHAMNLVQGETHLLGLKPNRIMMTRPVSKLSQRAVSGARGDAAKPGKTLVAGDCRWVRVMGAKSATWPNRNHRAVRAGARERKTPGPGGPGDGYHVDYAETLNRRQSKDREDYSWIEVRTASNTQRMKSD